MTRTYHSLAITIVEYTGETITLALDTPQGCRLISVKANRVLSAEFRNDERLFERHCEEGLKPILIPVIREMGGKINFWYAKQMEEWYIIVPIGKKRYCWKVENVVKLMSVLNSLRKHTNHRETGTVIELGVEKLTPTALTIVQYSNYWCLQDRMTKYYMVGRVTLTEDQMMYLGTLLRKEDEEEMTFILQTFLEESLSHHLPSLQNLIRVIRHVLGEWGEFQYSWRMGMMCKEILAERDSQAF